MDSVGENFSGISIEEALRLLEESKQKQRLLEKRIRELQSQSMTERLLTSKLPAKESPSSDIGPFSIQTTSETIVICGIDNDDCENFLQDYLAQGEQRSNRRETQPKSKLIINGRTVPINLGLPDRSDVNTNVTYEVERQELRFEIIKGKAKKDKIQPFKTYLTDQLSHFINSNYDMGTSFKPQLYAQGKVVEFEIEEEIAGNITQNTTTPPLAVVSATELPSIKATEKTGERKRAGSGSTDSEPQKGSIVGTNFFVKTMVNPKTAGLSFAVSTFSAILSKIESYFLEKMQDLEAGLPKRKKGARLDEEQAKALSKINDCKVALENLREIEELETPEERLKALEITDFALMNREIQIRINEVKEDIRQEAPKIIAQHLDIIMSHAFPELKRLPKAALDAVCKKFNVMVEGCFHWDQMPEIIETALALQLTPLRAIGEKSSDEVEDVDTVVLKQFGNP